MAMKAEEALAIAKSFTKKSLEGQGALKGEDGKDGVSPVVSVNTSTADTYKLDITDKNGTITTPNLVGKQGLRGETGETGADGETPTITENADNTEEVYKLDFTTKNGTFTTKNIIGKQGLEGVSPSVTTNPDNTAEDYRLNITTKGGTFTTPNLRGPQGEIGPQGESAASAINPRGDYDVNADPHYAVSDYITSAEGNTYVCKKDNPDNVAPTDGTINDEFWQVLALRGAKGESGKDGEKGADGATFTPSIDANGVLSFTNNGGLENPEPIDIKGDNGITFTPSIDADGYLSFTNNGNLENPEPIKVLGKDGEDGKDGIDGTTYIPSIGTVTTVESNTDVSAGVTVDEETKEAVFNFAIPKGENGADGFSPVVTVTETADGHNVAIEDKNGVKNFDVLDGKDGVQIDDVNDPSETSVWSSQKTSDEIAKVETELNDSLVDKANKEDVKNFKAVHVTNATLGVDIVSGQDNTRKVFDALKVGERYQDYWGNTSSVSKWGIAESYGNTVQIEIIKLGKGYGICTAMTNKNITLRRYIDTSMSETQPWQEIATMDKVNALHKQTVGYITGNLLSSAVESANLYYQKFGDNKLVINGWISLGSAVSGCTKIFTLPNGWKANSNYLLPCYSSNSNSAYACVIDIDSSDVNSYTPLPSGGELRFCAEIYLI